MLVVHATWHDTTLALWAEDAALPIRTTSRASVRPHPFAAPAADLADVLSVEHGQPADLTLRLPGTATSPASSPEVAHAQAATKPQLRLWRVPALLVDADHALDLLAGIDRDDTLSYGADVRYLAIVAGFAGDLVDRGRVLPGVRAERDGHAARWRPVLLGADAAYATRLAEAMPPICRALQAPVHSTAMVDQVLTSLADAAARRRLDPVLPPRRRGAAPLAERWLTALTGPDALFARPADDVSSLTEPLDGWFADVSRATGPVRAIFRLAEPEDDENRWAVEFALQSTSDPSLVVPAARVWEGVPFGDGHADEHLLTELGRASRLFPDLDRALRHAQPTNLALDTEGAHRFLTNAASLLRAAGFGVQLPRWVGAARFGVRMTTRSSTASDPVGASKGSGFSLDDLVKFRAELAIGDATISAEELAELARLKVPLVRVRGQWVELDERQLEAALKFLEGARTGTMTGREVLAEVMHRGGDLPLLEVDADGTLGDLLSGEAERRLAPVPTPDEFTATLRPYQERGVAWLAFLHDLGLGAVLADDMGLGKTVQLLAVLASERDRGDRPAPTLVVAPVSLVGNWRRETERFAPTLRTYVHHGGERHRGSDFATEAASADLVITTYGTATRDRDLLAGVRWARVVCDEAQAIKNSATKQATAVRSLPAASRMALTGTPVENRLGELWSIMEFANPGLLGPAASFRRRFAEPIEQGSDPEATAALKRATQPFILRRLKTDKTIISDLPDKQEIKVWCTLTPEQASLYQATVDEMLDKIANSDGIERRGLVLATMTKLKQACNHPAHLLKDGSGLPGRSGKLARLEETLDELLAEGDKALVFTQYAEFGTMLQPYLAARLGRPVQWLHGGVTKKRRDQMIDRKKALAEAIVGTGEDWLTELSVSELREVIALGGEGVDPA